jgi:predicted nucleotidyltransferase component of viral defense system
VIRKQDILDRAGEWGLRPDVVEKDYVLGWLLAAFAANEATSRTWAFKGGTCLKKCFFETYRFSEDLDFSLLPEAAHDDAALRAVLGDVVKRTAELSGIDLAVDRIELRSRRDKLGRPTSQGKLAYRGPLAMPNWPRVLLDITWHEAIVAPLDRRSIFHPYPDPLPDGARVLSYSMEELFAEKTRALLERTRPRDLYDVAHLWERRTEVALASVRDAFARKCAAKNIATPTASALSAAVRGSAELRADWDHMLGHQLPRLPLLDSLLDRLDEILGWIDAPRPLPPALEPVRLAAGQTRVALRGGNYWGGGQRLEQVRFAGANRLMIEFMYHGKLRLAEPYSFRRKHTGNLLLYAWERGGTTIKSFNTAEMGALRLTDVPFTPRFLVELTG